MMAKLGWPGLSTVVLAVAILPGCGCRRMTAAATHEVTPSPPAVAARSVAPAQIGGARFSFDSPLGGVVNPWSWPRAQGASERERAIEDIGPYEPADRGDPGAPLVNSNAHHWTARVGIAWTRDIDIDFDRETVDLDGDGAPDTRLSRHIHARGGILANPEMFGLTRTPDDPRGTVGRISIATGILGLREALTPDGRPSGQIGMTCFLCHGAADRDGQPVLGLPGTAFDYGLLLATAAVLSDDDPAAVAYRRNHGFPSGRTVRARLLLAGPGRQDLTGEFGLDITVPGTHSFYYPGTGRVRQGTSGIVNPISVPGIWMTGGLEVQNWSGSESASASAVNRLVALAARPDVRTDVGALLRALQLPALSEDRDGTGAEDEPPHEWASSWAATAFAARAPLRRALLFDLRNLGTLGLQQDSYPALLWADAIRDRARLSAAALVAIPDMYAAAAVRHVTEHAAQSWEDRRLSLVTSAPRERAIARGRALFADRIVGQIANLQILKEAPGIYAAAHLAGPVLAPIDPALPRLLAVRCADCHSASPGGAKISLARTAPPLGRCSHCHHSHLPFADAGEDGDAGEDNEGEAARRPLADLMVPASAQGEVALCRSCHGQHRDFAPVAFSSSALLPFDANENGRAQDDEAADARAGGIGTEALLAFDVPRPERPPSGFSVAIPRLASVRAVAAVHTARLGAGWVRVAPLVALRASAPYLHNGSVPTLRALLEAPVRRPVSFPLGKTGFRFDTRLPGNRNLGHAFGTQLSPAEKSDLVAFLESL